MTRVPFAELTDFKNVETFGKMESIKVYFSVLYPPVRHPNNYSLMKRHPWLILIGSRPRFLTREKKHRVNKILVGSKNKWLLHYTSKHSLFRIHKLLRKLSILEKCVAHDSYNSRRKNEKWWKMLSKWTMWIWQASPRGVLCNTFT